VALKPLLKQAAKSVALAAGSALPLRKDGARILTYHSVGRRDHEMNVTPEDFRVQMAWLSEYGEVVSLETAVVGGSGVAITFDDGYRDNLTEAAPVLHAHGFPATVFMVAGRPGGMLAHDVDPGTSTLMTWDELRELDASGIEIGGHTMSHPRLSTLTRDEQGDEIGRCAKELAEVLGHRIEAFAYPYGAATDYDTHSIDCVKSAGFKYACSNRYGTHKADADPWTVRRIWIDRTDSVETFAAKVDGRLDLLTYQDSGVGLALREWLNRRALE
jgi:peptidoglycan/xylan/chitin deacetylase (PgdA/CDA1 family)